MKKNMPSVPKKAMHASHVLNEPIEYQKSFSRGVRVGFGRYTMLFLSGTASVDEHGKTKHPRDFSAQLKRTFVNLTALLASEGATWHDVVQTRCYLKHMRHYQAFNEGRNLFYRQLKLDPFPASVCVEAGLCRPELKVEIEAMAIVRRGSAKNKRSKRV